MAFSNDTHWQRRWRKAWGYIQSLRRGFWRKLQNPQTWKFIVMMGFFIVRLVRLVRWVLELFE